MAAKTYQQAMCERGGEKKTGDVESRLERRKKSSFTVWGGDNARHWFRGESD